MKVIVNASAGAGACGVEQVRAACAAAGLQPEIISPGPDEKISAVVRRAIADSGGAVIAAGGDGTISAVAAELVGSGRTLGVLPAGTLNHFAKDLGIPTDIESAARVIADGHTVEVDVAEVNGVPFINNSSLGIYPRIVSKREAQQERLARGKWPAFLWATLHALRRFPFLQLRITLPHQQLTRRTAFLFVGNNEYEIHGFRIGARATLDRGRLGLYFTHRTGRLRLLRLALRALFHRLEQAKDFEAHSVSEVTIESRHDRLLVARDGEVDWMTTPLHYRTRPRALKVFAPAKE
jgi:diacylglycerol kinase family enzyme